MPSLAAKSAIGPLPSTCGSVGGDLAFARADPRADDVAQPVLGELDQTADPALTLQQVGDAASGIFAQTAQNTVQNPIVRLRLRCDASVARLRYARMTVRAHEKARRDPAGFVSLVWNDP